MSAGHVILCLVTATASARPLARRWAPGRPVDVSATWGTLRRGAGDPTWKVADGVLWRGIRTPSGPATLRLATQHRDRSVVAHVWGTPEAAEWLLERLPQMLGQDDDPSGFEPRPHGVAAALARRGAGWRVAGRVTRWS